VTGGASQRQRGRPVIGITVSLDPGRRIREGFEYLYVGRAYARAVSAAGGAPVLLPPDLAVPDAVALCDGIVLSGGALLPASLAASGAPAVDAASGASRDEAELHERIGWDRRLVEAALARRRPLLGVCYGMQLLNLHLGGTLAPAPDAAGGVDHGGGGRVTAHEVVMDPETILGAALGTRARVASAHQQVVDRLAPGLCPAAHAPDGALEAFEGTELLGVEWHPELDDTGPAVYGWLLSRAQEPA
jgi:putative glutamine amidotransferase